HFGRDHRRALLLSGARPRHRHSARPPRLAPRRPRARPRRPDRPYAPPRRILPGLVSSDFASPSCRSVYNPGAFHTRLFYAILFTPFTRWDCGDSYLPDLHGQSLRRPGGGVFRYHRVSRLQGPIRSLSCEPGAGDHAWTGCGGDGTAADAPDGREPRTGAYWRLRFV